MIIIIQKEESKIKMMTIKDDKLKVEFITAFSFLGSSLNIYDSKNKILQLTKGDMLIVDSQVLFYKK